MSKGNEHAFPHMHLDTRGTIDLKGGLTKREAFAKAAMQGICANPNLVGVNALLGWVMPMTNGPEQLERFALARADALLAELSEPQLFVTDDIYADLKHIQSKQCTCDVEDRDSGGTRGVTCDLCALLARIEEGR